LILVEVHGSATDFTGDPPPGSADREHDPHAGRMNSAGRAKSSGSGGKSPTGGENNPARRAGELGARAKKVRVAKLFARDVGEKLGLWG